jgi:hypothetical protein
MAVQIRHHKGAKFNVSTPTLRKMMMTPQIVYIHSPCRDGDFSRALIHILLDHNIDIRSVSHDDLFLNWDPIEDIGKTIWFVDIFPHHLVLPSVTEVGLLSTTTSTVNHNTNNNKDISYPPLVNEKKSVSTTLSTCLTTSSGNWYVIDHHLSTMNVLSKYSELADHFWINLDKCASTMIWDMCSSIETKDNIPYMLKCVESRDNRGCSDDFQSLLMLEWIYTTDLINIDFRAILAITGPEDKQAIALRAKGLSLCAKAITQAESDLGNAYICPYHVEEKYKPMFGLSQREQHQQSRPLNICYLRNVSAQSGIYVQYAYENHKLKYDTLYGNSHGVDIYVFYSDQPLSTTIQKKDTVFNISLRNAVPSKYNLTAFSEMIKGLNPTMCISNGGHPNASGCTFNREFLHERTRSDQLFHL